MRAQASHDTMTPNFRIVGLDPVAFEPLFRLDDQTLQRLGAARRIATACPGYPCRVGLDDAAVGDELLLLTHVHHDVASPYRASGPVFVRRGARAARLVPGEVPPCVTRRQISLRGYGAVHTMLYARLCDGAEVAQALQDLFGDARVAYVDLHNAAAGCFACRALRA